MKKIYAYMILLLLILAGASWAGGNTGSAARLSCIGEPLHGETQESLADNLPGIPASVFRFSARQSRVVTAPGSRVRPWTPVDISIQEILLHKSYPVVGGFDLPDGVKANCTAQNLCTSPVRAGPEYILS